MKWEALQHKTIGIWGQGREGLSAQKALQRFVPNAKIVLFDDSSLNCLFDCEVVITSPGVSIYRPEIEKAKQQGILFTTGTNLFLANKKPMTTVIGVTGTKGKSTTSSIIYHLLSQYDACTALGGNIGKPLLDLLSDDLHFVVAELSSYQCASLQYGCNAAVLLNLYPEHLQWHQTHENYYNDKCRLIKLSDQAAVNGSNEEIMKHLKNLSNIRYFNTNTTWHIKDNYFYNASKKVIPVHSLPLSGLHNAVNACAALSLLSLLNLSIEPEKIRQGFQNVRPLPHRLQNLGTYRHIQFIDDSISTTPESTIAALKTFENFPYITLIAGGFDRGQNYETLIRYILPLKEKLFIIALPDTGKRLYQEARKAGLSASYEENMLNAVQKAFAVTPETGIVLLSPAAPSYNLYKNFEERGKDFLLAVQKSVEL